jgi:hypothetical protein
MSLVSGDGSVVYSGQVTHTKTWLPENDMFRKAEPSSTVRTVGTAQFIDSILHSSLPIGLVLSPWVAGATFKTSHSDRGRSMPALGWVSL